MTLSHLNTPMYLLGFVPKEDRVFLIDKAYNVVSYKVLLSVLNYQTAVVRKDFVTANSILPSIPRSEHCAVARFLESQGFKEEALAVSSDPDHRFELAVDLRKMDVAHAVLLDPEVTNCPSTLATPRCSTYSQYILLIPLLYNHFHAFYQFILSTHSIHSPNQPTLNKPTLSPEQNG